MFRLQSQNRNLPTVPRLLARAPLHAAGALPLLLASQPLPAQNPSTREDRTMANYLANFPSFAEWPQEALPFESAPFLIYVFGDFPFGTSLAKITRVDRSTIGALKFAGYASHSSCLRAEINR